MSLLWACGPSVGPPRPDSCDGASADGVTAVAIGPESSSPTDPFVAWHDGDTATSQQGGQGAPMLVLRLAVSGPSPPSCLQQVTEVIEPEPSGATSLLGHDSVARKTYAQPDGSRATANLFIVVDALPYSLVVKTTVGGVAVTRMLGHVSADLSATPADMTVRDLATHD